MTLESFRRLTWIFGSAPFFVRRRFMIWCCLFSAAKWRQARPASTHLVWNVDHKNTPNITMHCWLMRSCSSFFAPPASLTSPVLGLKNRCQLAGRNFSGHLSCAHCLPMLAGHMERRVTILVLQPQASPFLHQALHHVCQVQVSGQVQRALKDRQRTRMFILDSLTRLIYFYFSFSSAYPLKQPPREQVRTCSIQLSVTYEQRDQQRFQMRKWESHFQPKTNKSCGCAEFSSTEATVGVAFDTYQWWLYPFLFHLTLEAAVGLNCNLCNAEWNRKKKGHENASSSAFLKKNAKCQRVGSLFKNPYMVMSPNVRS